MFTKLIRTWYFVIMFVTNLCVKLCVLFLYHVSVQCNAQVGPDPWDLQMNDNLSPIDELNIPPDLRAIPKKKLPLESNAGPGDWFFKRILAIMLKGGQVKKNEDGTVNVDLQMKFDKEKWQLLESYTAINTILTEDMVRRSMGHVEEAIYRPTVIEKVIVMWSDYIQSFLIEYKMLITWSLGILAITGAVLWLWKHMSHKHIYIILFIALYTYEVFTSYKEAEKEELERFLSAVNKCKWYIWSSECDLPPPDPLIFIKHMNPLKIGIRMITTVVTEPMLSISETIKILVHGLTDGLWFPIDKIMYGILVINLNILLILFLIMIIFNYILNIPFNFSFLGLFRVGLPQHSKYFVNNAPETSRIENSDRISGATLNRLLDVCSRALCTAQSARSSVQNCTEPQLRLSESTITRHKIRRSASTGRLPDSRNSDQQIENVVKFRRIPYKVNLNGSGDGLNL